jgi:hypothetical protein
MRNNEHKGEDRDKYDIHPFLVLLLIFRSYVRGTMRTGGRGQVGVLDSTVPTDTCPHHQDPSLLSILRARDVSTCWAQHAPVVKRNLRHFHRIAETSLAQIVLAQIVLVGGRYASSSSQITHFPSFRFDEYFCANNSVMGE